MKLVIAIPTILVREDAWKVVGAEWSAKTRHPVHIEPSWRKPTWSAGLNEVWEKHPDADIFVCASDDMHPEDDEWYDAALKVLDRGESPVPRMLDPRFEIKGGVISDKEREDGAESAMTNFPILKREWLKAIFPLPEDLHYFSDNLIADRLHAIGVKTVYARDLVIRHLWDERGRGAGMIDESTRMAHDKAIYRELGRRST